jgi:deoxyribose-phosphate aldolase
MAHAQASKTGLSRQPLALADVLQAALAGDSAGITEAGGLARVEREVAALLDHTLLRPEATAKEIEQLCSDGAKFGFASVCVNPAWVPRAAESLRGTPVRICAVAGFPLGATLTHAKAFEAEQAIWAGATEIDMVIHIGALKSGDDSEVEADIRCVVEACHRRGALTKVILEMALLTLDEKVRGCRAAVRAGANFVKTSTGFGPRGATVEDVALLRATAPPGIGVKAAGGIRTLGNLAKMVAAGATRIGSSSGVTILEELRGLAASK